MSSGIYSSRRAKCNNMITIIEIFGIGNHVIYFKLTQFLCLFLQSWLILEMTDGLLNWANSQNDNYFHSKWSMVVALGENNCHFVNFLSFACSSFFLSSVIQVRQDFLLILAIGLLFLFSPTFPILWVINCPSCPPTSLTVG